MRRICVNEYFCFENVLEVSRSVEGVMLCETCLLPPSPPPSRYIHSASRLCPPWQWGELKSSDMRGLIHLKNSDLGMGISLHCKRLAFAVQDSGFTPSYGWERWGVGRERKTETTMMTLNQDSNLSMHSLSWNHLILALSIFLHKNYKIFANLRKES